MTAQEFEIHEASREDVESIFSDKRLRDNVGEEGVTNLLSLEPSSYIIQFDKYKMLFTIEALASQGAVELHACFPRSSLIGSRVLLLGLMLHLFELGIKVICIPVRQNNLVCIRNSLKKLGFIETVTVEDETFFMVNLEEIQS